MTGSPLDPARTVRVPVAMPCAVAPLTLMLQTPLTVAGAVPVLVRVRSQLPGGPWVHVPTPAATCALLVNDPKEAEDETGDGDGLQ